jgi:hypothetical protein
MSDNAQLVSKVLVLESNREYYDRIKHFCDNNNLVGLKALEDNVMVILKSNVDLGAILLSENYGGDARGGIVLAREIREIRPELPIFLRREKNESMNDLSEKEQKMFCAAYTIDNISSLRAVFDKSIFSLVYPNVLVRGITEITVSALESQFKDIDVGTETPYIVRDRIIYGEIFSLIPLESSWCRGYMMLQTEEENMLYLVKMEKTHIKPDSANFRHLDNILGEVTNLIWGSFKNRFISDIDKYGQFHTQVPILINHQHKYISFGSEDPQLCFRYTLTDKHDTGKSPLVIYQRFVFNLNWSPGDFKEIQASVEELVESGELELF